MTASAESPSPRRRFIKEVLSAGAALFTTGAVAKRLAASVPQAAGVTALDHVAIPITRVDEMVTFYAALGFVVRDGGQIISIHFGDQKINFHRPELWQRDTFTLRAAAARPPCGDFCWVWQGSAASLSETLARAGAEIEAEGPRAGGRDGGDATGQSVYTRDPDGNLLEFMRYG
jgi:catechol 2,3-dioxygenase-like lactoylglutathione lyase family enzyme